MTPKCLKLEVGHMNIDLFKVVEIFKDDFPDTKLVKSIMMDLYTDEKAEMNLLCNI